jgi:hypothetical protein
MPGNVGNTLFEYTCTYRPIQRILGYYRRPIREIYDNSILCKAVLVNIQSDVYIHV